MSQVVAAGALLSLAVVSAVLVVRRARHPVTSILVVITAATGLSYVTPSFLTDTMWVLSVLPLSALLVVFPDGPRGQRWRWALWYLFAVIGLTALLALIPLAGTPAANITAALALSVLPIAGAAVVSLVRLWRHSNGERRFRIGLVLAAGLALVSPWLLLPVLWLAVGEQHWDRVDAAVDPLYAGLMYTIVPLAVGVSMLLEPVGRRWALLERTWPAMLGAGAALLLGGTVVEVAVSLGATAGSPGVVAATSLAVAGGVGWVVGLVRRSPYRLVSADDRAARALRDLAERLDTVPDVDAVPALVARAVGGALDLVGVAVDVDVQGRNKRLAAWGSLDGPLVVRELTHAGERAGRLVLVPHRDGVSVDLAVLEPLLPSVAATVAAIGLTERLAAAREQVRRAREGERVRLRDDLHDELSPSLSGVRLTVHAARALLPTLDASEPPIAAEGDHDADSATAVETVANVDRLLARADAGLAHSSTVITGILEDLRPDALDDGGLVAAVRARASDFDRPGFQVCVNGAAPLPPLSPTVEVAALRVASEAICNAARHSGGTACVASIEGCHGGVRLTVTDDGSGVAADHPRGVGLESMHTRTTAAGGRLTIGPGATGGTVVAAWFPAALPHSTGSDLGSQP